MHCVPLYSRDSQKGLSYGVVSLLDKLPSGSEQKRRLYGAVATAYSLLHAVQCGHGVTVPLQAGCSA